MTKSLVIDGRPMSSIEIAHLNEDWFGWSDAPGGKKYTAEQIAGLLAFEATLPELNEEFEAGFGAQVDADLDAGATWEEIELALEPILVIEEWGDDVDFAQAQVVAECAEASWHRFCCNGR